MATDARSIAATWGEWGEPQLAPEIDADGISADEFKTALRNYPGGVSLISADAGHGPVALTASSVISVSAAPPLLVLSISDLSSSARTLHQAETLVVHLLSAADLSLAQLGATSGIDRFADRSRWERLVTGEPYVPSVATWIRGRIINRMRAGTSTVMVIQAIGTSAQPSTAPAASIAPALVYHNRTWHRLDASSRIPDEALVSTP